MHERPVPAVGRLQPDAAAQERVVRRHPVGHRRRLRRRNLARRPARPRRAPVAQPVDDDVPVVLHPQLAGPVAARPGRPDRPAEVVRDEVAVALHPQPRAAPAERPRHPAHRSRQDDVAVRLLRQRVEAVRALDGLASPERGRGRDAVRGRRPRRHVGRQREQQLVRRVRAGAGDRATGRGGVDRRRDLQPASPSGGSGGSSPPCRTRAARRSRCPTRRRARSSPGVMSKLATTLPPGAHRSRQARCASGSRRARPPPCSRRR